MANYKKEELLSGSYTNDDLRNICKEKGLIGYSKKPKLVLVDMILNSQSKPVTSSSPNKISGDAINIKGLEITKKVNILENQVELISVELSCGAENKTWPVKAGTTVRDLLNLVGPIMNIDPNIKSVIIDGKDVSLDFVLTNSTSMDVTKKTGSKG